MADGAVTVRRLNLHPKRKYPLVWVGRIVIFENYNPLKLLRDVPLHRGLNIVWGKEATGGSGDAEVDGHGVGKTTFCRLIRYCLGEKHFGRARARERIRAAFPGGYVGADVYVDGQRWAVARPIGNSRLSYARKDSTIEDLLASRPGSETYHEFRQHLEERTLRDLLVGATIGANEPIKWDHMLAWCSRDQECRFQSLWDWRSPRSDSETPQFQKPKLDGTLMLRAVLGLLRDEEVKLEEELVGEDRKIEKLNVEVVERKREPEYWSKHYRKRLATAYGIIGAETIAVQSTELFGMPALVNVKRNQLAADADAQAVRLKGIDRELLTLAAQLGEIEQFVDIDTATGGVKAEGADVIAAESEERQRELEELRKIAPVKWCKYGQTSLDDCFYVQARLAESTQAATAPSQLRVLAANDQVAAAANERLAGWTRMVESIKSKREQLLSDRRQAEEKRYALLSQARDLDASFTSLQAWDSYFTNQSPDPKLISLNEDLAVAEKRRTELKNKLVSLLESHSAQRSELTRVYDGAVSSVLSNTYHGRIDLSDDELLYALAKVGDLGGEALETLAILLADASAMLLAMEDKCLHPGILLHDSPREADLGARIYRSLLSFFKELHDALGGDENAPFQYIVTTTTPPPEHVQTGRTVILPLSGASPENLLFGRELTPQSQAAGGTGDPSLYSSD